MKIQFDLTETDLYEFYRFHNWYSIDKKSFRLRKRLYWGTFMLLFPFAFFTFTGKQFTQPIFLNLLVFGIFMFVLGYYLAKQVILSRVDKWAIKFLKDGKNQDLIGPREIVFTNDSIETRTDNSDGRINYKLIEKLREDENLYFIYISAISAIVIPKRIFKTSKELSDLKETVEKNYRQQNV